MNGQDVGDIMSNIYGNPAWFQYDYDAPLNPPFGIHTVAVEITDNTGAVTIVRTPPFTFSQPICCDGSPICPNPDRFNGPHCRLATATQNP